MSLRNHILDEARRIGFNAVGIARAAPAGKFAIFTGWLQSGYAADMEFLARNIDKRADITRLMEGVKSVVVVAASYPVNGRPGKGFASYSRGQDYHLVLKNKLAILADSIRQQADVKSRICVDSAPVCEREWAIAAGIGWRGKQGQVVNPDFGCCSVIGELLLDIELEPSDPIPNQCETCRKCIEACPTRAINENGLVDCRRCLSYLTIEHRGKIATDLRQNIGQALFGCDACTAVCPWNKNRINDIMNELKWNDMPEAKEISAMTEEEFRNRFKDTSIERTGLERLKRNAFITLENSRD